MKQPRYVSRRQATMLIAFLLLILLDSLFASAQSKEKAGTANDVVAANQSTAAPKTPNIDPAALRPEDAFVIGPEDVLAINVWREADISRTVTVRSDGKVSLALIGEVQASGLTPRELEINLKHKLSTYFADPVVTVIVQEIRSRRFSILGSVSRPGSYVFTSTMTVVDAIAVAGGFRDFAKQNSIYVIRQNLDGTQSRMPFNYKDFIKGKNPTQNVKLRSNDVVIVP